MFKPLLTLLAAVLCAFSALAQVELNPEHPESYVVKRGDTLWDIAEMFLRDPWLWPEIWHINPQIENPHLIYPGDVINLSFVGGEPRLTVQRGERPTRQLSPHIRRSPIRDAIEPINLSDIRPFLEKRTILTEEEVDGLPYVVAIQEGYLAGTEGQQIYTRGLDAEVGESYAVVRPTVVFRDFPGDEPFNYDIDARPASEPWGYPAEKSIGDYIEEFWDANISRHWEDSAEILGYEVRQVAVGEVISTGDPTTLTIISSDIEVLPGDLVIPVFSSNYDLEYMPHAMVDVPDNTRVVGLSKGLFAAGRYQVVAINKGWEDGIEHGHVLSVHYPSRVIRDKVRYPRDDVKTFFSRERRRNAAVELPEEYAGHVMVFKAYDNLSYGLVVRASRAVRVGNVLHQP